MVKKVLLIPLCLVSGKFVSNFLEKSNIFNDFFSQQCQPISNESILPLTPYYYTDEILSGVNFNHSKTLRVIQFLDPNKAHGHDGVSVRLLKLSSPSIINPLFIIFRNCLKFGTFSR